MLISEPFSAREGRVVCLSTLRTGEIRCMKQFLTWLSHFAIFSTIYNVLKVFGFVTLAGRRNLVTASALPFFTCTWYRVVGFFSMFRLLRVCSVYEFPVFYFIFLFYKVCSTIQLITKRQFKHTQYKLSGNSVIATVKCKLTIHGNYPTHGNHLLTAWCCVIPVLIKCHPITYNLLLFDSWPLLSKHFF